MYATFIQVPDTIDYTAGTAGVNCGDIVIQGGTDGKIVGIPSSDIPANTLGAISTGGIYDVVKGSSISFAAGADVYWDNSAHVATSVSTNHTLIGKAIAVALSTDSLVRVMLNAGGSGASSGGSSSITVPQSAITSLTDHSSGTAGNTIQEIEDTGTADAVASLAAKINAILAALRSAGIINS